MKQAERVRNGYYRNQQNLKGYLISEGFRRISNLILKWTEVLKKYSVIFTAYQFRSSVRVW
jgi:hypothetical protein